MSKTCEWATPQELYDTLDKEFHFALDPCSTDDNHKCKRWFTKEQDGLKQTWDDAVFMNPPYGREISKWVEKAWKEHVENNITVVMLLPARTDTKWFHKYIYHRCEIRFISGRIKFGGCDNPAPFPSMVCIYRKR